LRINPLRAEKSASPRPGINSGRTGQRHHHRLERSLQWQNVIATTVLIIVLTLAAGLIQTLIGEPEGCRMDSLSGEEIGRDC
jgi:hypothetical protein